MSSIVLDADKNEKWMESHGDVLEKEIADEESSAPIGRRVYRETYIPPEELDKLREVYSHVVVQDFEDSYHLSRQEREKEREKYGKFFALRQNFTKKIRKIDKYVEACRICMDIVKQTADENGIYSREKFMEKFMDGEIEINGLKFPKYQGKDKKRLDWDFIMELILHPEMDISVIRESTSDDLDTIIDVDKLFDEREIADITNSAFDNDSNEHAIYDMDLEGDNVAGYLTKKERKRLIKANPAYIHIVKDIRKSGSQRRKNMEIWNLTEKEQHYIEAYDDKLLKKKRQAVPVFSGNIDDPDAVNSYLYQMEQYERETELVEFNGRMITIEEMEDIQFKDALEKNGWNLRNIYGNKEREREQRRRKKEETKKIARMKAMLEKLQAASEERESRESDGGIGINTKKKSKKKKSKKEKKASKKIDEIILDAFSPDDDNMKAYAERMQNMKWGEK